MRERRDLAKLANIFIGLLESDSEPSQFQVVVKPELGNFDESVIALTPKSRKLYISRKSCTSVLILRDRLLEILPLAWALMETAIERQAIERRRRRHETRSEDWNYAAVMAVNPRRSIEYQMRAKACDAEALDCIRNMAKLLKERSSYNSQKLKDELFNESVVILWAKRRKIYISRDRCTSVLILRDHLIRKLPQ